MPRRKKRGVISATFRKIFDDHPDWVESRSNDLVLSEFFKAHPGQVGNKKKIAANLANFKSNKRRALRKSKRGRKPGQIAGAKTSPAAPRPRSLEQLEIHIDNSMRIAQNMANNELDDVIGHLRKARNLVVWKAGQP